MMRVVRAGTLLLAAAVLVGIGCKKASPGGRFASVGGGVLGYQSVASSVHQEAAAAAPRVLEEAVSKAAPGRDSALAAMDAGRKLIRNGEIAIEVRDFDASGRKVADLARSLGGYVADSQAVGDGGGRRGTLTIRVRASSFDEALRELRSLGKVQSEHVGTQDITKAYTDLEARLRVKRDAAERVREILRTRTARLSDVLEAEKQLSDLIEQIEVMEGEHRYYDQQVALSTIAAELHEPEAVTRPSAFAPLRDALRDSIYNLSASLAVFVTGIVYILPWALLAGVLLILLRGVRRRSARIATPK